MQKKSLKTLPLKGEKVLYSFKNSMKPGIKFIEKNSIEILNDFLE